MALAVSLHAPTDALRDPLVPLNRKYPIDELLQTIELDAAPVVSGLAVAILANQLCFIYAVKTTNASVVGIVLALLIDSSWRIEQALWPFLIASQVMPVVAFAPIIIVWFGFGLLPKVLMTFLIAFFPIVIATTAGFMNVDRNIDYQPPK